MKACKTIAMELTGEAAVGQYSLGHCKGLLHYQRETEGMGDLKNLRNYNQ
jgi:hypothetical protein